MTIPAKFKLFAKTITVIGQSDLVKDKGLYGQADYTDSTITLQVSVAGFTRSQESIEQTFYHELCHHILYSMSEKALQNNEKFVDLFSRLLHQALTTQEGGMNAV